MWQYFQSPQEYETNDEGSLTILHKVELTDKDMEYLQTKTGNIVDKIQEIDSRIDQVAAGWKTRRMGKVELTICVWPSMRWTMILRTPEGSGQ